MGLDMYLTAKVYFYEYDNRKEIEDAIEQIKSMSSSLSLPASWKPKTIVFEVMYWRKANAIHNWFVKNVQGGKDDCHEYEVCSSDLKKLLDDINNILNEDSNAKQEEFINNLLPPRPGFFFGSTDIDEYYFEVLKYTKKELEKLLQLYDTKPNCIWWFEYHSSW